MAMRCATSGERSECVPRFPELRPASPYDTSRASRGRRQEGGTPRAPGRRRGRPQLLREVDGRAGIGRLVSCRARLRLIATRNTELSNRLPMKKIIAISLALLSGCLHAEPIHKPVHECAKRGIYQAKSLLEFHFGPDDRIDIDENVTVLP